MRQFNYRAVRLKHSFKREKHHLTNCHEKDTFSYFLHFTNLTRMVQKSLPCTQTKDNRIFAAFCNHLRIRPLHYMAECKSRDLGCFHAAKCPIWAIFSLIEKRKNIQNTRVKLQKRTCEVCRLHWRSQRSCLHKSVLETFLVLFCLVSCQKTK